MKGTSSMKRRILTLMALVILVVFGKWAVAGPPEKSDQATEWTPQRVAELVALCGAPPTQEEVDELVALLGAPPEPQAALDSMSCDCTYFQQYEGEEYVYNLWLNASHCEVQWAEDARVACLNAWRTERLHKIAAYYMDCKYGDCFSAWCDDQYNYGSICHSAYGNPLPWEGCALTHNPCTWDYDCLHQFLPVGPPEWRPENCSHMRYDPPAPYCPCENVVD